MLAGIEETSPIDTGGMVGGTQSSAFGALRQVRQYRTLGSPDDAEQFFLGQVGDYPAAVLSWQASYPWDGSSTASGASDTTRIADGERLFRHEWRIQVVTSRLESEYRRRREGDTVRDNLMERLTDEIAHRGLCLSNPDGLTVIEARLAGLTPTTFIDVIRLTSSYVLKLREDEDFADWEQTRLRLQTEKQGSPPQESPEIDVPDITFPTLP